MPNPKTFYLKGALRDGCLTTQWNVKFVQKSREWLSEVVLPLLNKSFNQSFKENCIYFDSRKWPYWYITISNKKLWHELSHLQKLEPFSSEEQRFYIMAFWDTDGGCPKQPSKNKKIYLKFTQKDKKSLVELKRMIEKTFGIKCGRVRISELKKNGPVWRFTITNKKGIINFCNRIGSLHPEKKLRLERIKGLLAG